MFDGIKNYLETPEPTPVTEEVKTDVVDNETIDHVVEEKVETEVETKEQPKETSVKEQVDEVKPEPIELSDNDILSYLKDKRGFEGDTLDVLFQKNEVDPFDGYSDEVKEFLKFSKETNGRGIDDWISLRKDYTKVSPLELAREKAIKESDGALTRNDVDEYLEKKLGITLTDEAEMDKFDLIDLKKYGKDYLQSKIDEQEKYRKPIEQKANEITLEDGSKVSQEEYQQLLKNQKKAYLDTIKKSSDNIKGLGFEIPFDVNGESKTISINYDYSQEDKHKMVSDASDIDSFFVKAFRNKDGSIKAQELQEAMWRMNPENFNKVVIDAAQKMTAEVIEMNLAKENNFKFPTDKIPAKKSQKTIPVPGQFSPEFKQFL